MNILKDNLMCLWHIHTCLPHMTHTCVQVRDSANVVGAKSQTVKQCVASPDASNETHFPRTSVVAAHRPIHWPAEETPVDGKQRADETKALAAREVLTFLRVIGAYSTFAGNKILKAGKRKSEESSTKLKIILFKKKTDTNWIKHALTIVKLNFP